MTGGGGHYTIWDILLFGIAYNVCFPKKLARLLIYRFELPIPNPLITIRIAALATYLVAAFLFVRMELVDNLFVTFIPLVYMTVIAVIYAAVLSMTGYGADDDPWT